METLRAKLAVARSFLIFPGDDERKCARARENGLPSPSGAVDGRRRRLGHDDRHGTQAGEGAFG
jgi:hypothetical protein